MLATAANQISHIEVWVFREPEAAKLYKDENGRKELPAKVDKTDVFEVG